tara:strand:+ start:140 stop:610 length:471 start_codon:yes stop_codon:yes gene_type:complete
MKYIKKYSLLAVLAIIILSFSKIKNTAKINLSETNSEILEFLSIQQFECRPSSKFKFYVDTKILKKSRGFSTIQAKIYIVENKSGKSNLLATENIIAPIQKDIVLAYNEVIQTDLKLLENGDKILNYKTNFSELLGFSTIYDSYLTSRNKLLSRKI